ncbi:MAG TPA: hypothetical protein VKZ92_05910 [Pseudohongiella sp.]|nr:hypothetical protein [Pseudohongiella sp.]
MYQRFNPRLLSALTLLAAGLAGCNPQSSAPAPLPPAVNGWIEIPLAENIFGESSVPFQHGHYQIPLAAGEELEYKLRMLEGDSVVYRWSVDMQLPALLNVEFHGHTDRAPGEDGLLMFYKKHNEGHESGRLTAPFTGIHGWYLHNQSAENIVVELEVAGFYSVEN